VIIALDIAVDSQHQVNTIERCGVFVCVVRYGAVDPPNLGDCECAYLAIDSSTSGEPCFDLILAWGLRFIYVHMRCTSLLYPCTALFVLLCVIRMSTNWLRISLIGSPPDGRIQSIALLNSTNHNFNVIAPSQLLRDFSGGAYLVWRTHGSVRLRVAKVGGDPGGMDACISGLFWG
jgi:hypothetical protein